MLTNLKLLTTEPNFDVEFLFEESSRSGEQSLFINGPYLMAEKKNKNGRIYTLDEMVPEMSRYKKEMIDTKRSLGELNHPASAEINPERAAHMITEINQMGTTFNGKSKVLKTPMGLIVRSLVNDGVKLGTSSRALGKLTEGSRGNVVTNFRYICNDIVHDPSVDVAFVNGILESKEYVLHADGSLEEHYDDLETSVERLPKHEVNEFLKEQVLAFLDKLKKK